MKLLLSGKSVCVRVCMSVPQAITNHSRKNEAEITNYCFSVSLHDWGEQSKPHTGSGRFNRGTRVTFPKVYATNTESPPMLVVYSTVVRASRSQKFTLEARKDLLVWRAEFKVLKKEERLRRRREHDRLVIPASLDG